MQAQQTLKILGSDKIKRNNMKKIIAPFTHKLMLNTNNNKTSPWELMDPQTKNDSDKTQDIRMPYVGNGYV